jgi:hypothetical protein
MEPSAPPPWRNPRKHPRVTLVTQVESRARGQTCLGRVENISVGGMLVLTRDTFEAGSEVVVRFNLPGGGHVEATARVMHTKPGAQMGLQFLGLKEEERRAIAGYVQEVKPYTRRSVRLARRVSLFLRWKDSEGNEREEVVETRLWSRYGGMVLAEVSLKPGTDIVLVWPDGKEARARVVYRGLGGEGGLAELGFEFLEAGNFWGIEFPPDPKLWEPM